MDACDRHQDEEQGQDREREHHQPAIRRTRAQLHRENTYAHGIGTRVLRDYDACSGAGRNTNERLAKKATTVTKNSTPILLGTGDKPTVPTVR
jgi:hypothetical protein